MKSPHAKGKTLVIAITVLCLVISAAATVSDCMRYGTAKLLWHTIRFILAAALCYFLWRGYRWARVLLALVFLAAGSASTVISFWQAGTLRGFFVLCMGISYLLFYGVLMFSRDVIAFRESQERSRT